MAKGIIASIDFSAQELRVIAERSRDQNMLDCFIGDNKKDMHALTAVGIMLKKSARALWQSLGHEGDPPDDVAARWKEYDYGVFEAARRNQDHPDYTLAAKVLRPIGKKTNFTTEYGAMAPKLSETLIVPVEEAQIYIDAKLLAFPKAEAWKRQVVVECHKRGYGITMLGARRHLPGLYSSNGYDIGKAERQGVNFEVQGSCAEMTKLAEGRLWKAKLYSHFLDRAVNGAFNARYYGPIHDELVSSVVGTQTEIVEFIRRKHELMTQNYANMTVPIVGSISVGPNFGEQIECNDEEHEGVWEEKIREALTSLGVPDTMRSL